MTKRSTQRLAKKDKRERDRRLAALAAVGLFDTVPEQDMELLVDGLRRAPFAVGEALTRQGAEAHWLYMIIEGEASVAVRHKQREREVARLSDGDFFGEMSLMTGEPRSATVTAITDIECYRLDKEVFEEIIARHPKIADDVADVLARRKLELAEITDGMGTVTRSPHDEKQALLGRIRSFFSLD